MLTKVELKFSEVITLKNVLGNERKRLVSELKKVQENSSDIRDHKYYLDRIVYIDDILEKLEGGK